MRFLLTVIIDALALWLTTLIVSGVTVRPYSDSDTAGVLTFLLVALIFGVVNASVGRVVRFLAIPLYILTLGLIAIAVNALLLAIVAWVSGLMGFGLSIADFWSGMFGALALGVIAWFFGLILRPKSRR